MDNTIIIKKTRGRKKKVLDSSTLPEDSENIQLIIEESNEPNVAVVKKRGRKPKGGKLILKQTENDNKLQSVTNIILHLKCSMQDLNEHNTNIQNIVTDPLTYNPTIPPNIMTYNSSELTTGFSSFTNNANNTEIIPEKDIPNFAYNDNFNNKTTVCQVCNSKNDNKTTEDDTTIIDDDDSDINIKDINNKLKRVKLQLYKNSNPDKKSACFWCTYDYDNPICYIPKYEIDGQLYGYGSFCRPECAVAYLMEENIDDSTKFERYHLLNQIYSKVYEYKKNIKPAPNPYYLLDKFYGNLSIQEYRKLLKSEHMLLVIEKPMTRILPELHEDNEDFIMNIYGTKQTQANQGGVYKVKRQSEKQKGPSKSSIIKDSFGLA
jgi:hypothetical protein